jgi:hypothetical protein
MTGAEVTPAFCGRRTFEGRSDRNEVMAQPFELRRASQAARISRLEFHD